MEIHQSFLKTLVDIQIEQVTSSAGWLKSRKIYKDSAEKQKTIINN